MNTRHARQRRGRIAWVLTCLIGLSLVGSMLGACGRIGSPQPPGPRSDFTYNRSYPAPDR
ncbi:hypothetical protein NO263_16010 [Gluconacetobacter entanii]|uniref:Lipoprotein n=1 Tax=Gluconacetobacter entanii TaxID=108528 RepID=A0ABT3K9K6_9PROT|nr:hypothetical protein [Gluconacetobacter entanii]MCW4592088.1 hypothetical protein [Gluconacetobacter entanii]MCW4595167.1 hypothetical protein [Gluconacetobacter entanii]NPC88864.1 hypothetical protein [Gluconacetobacter entanii]